MLYSCIEEVRSALLCAGTDDNDVVISATTSVDFSIAVGRCWTQ